MTRTRTAPAAIDLKTTAADLDRVLALVASAAPVLGAMAPAVRRDLFHAVAGVLGAAADELVFIAVWGSHLTETRLRVEVARTTFQLRLLSDEVVQALEPVLDRLDPQCPACGQRDLCRAMGPVLVFAASNLPFAFSVAGGDTAARASGADPLPRRDGQRQPGLRDSGRCCWGRARHRRGLRCVVRARRWAVLHEVRGALCRTGRADSRCGGPGCGAAFSSTCRYCAGRSAFMGQADRCRASLRHRGLLRASGRDAHRRRPRRRRRRPDPGRPGAASSQVRVGRMTYFRGTMAVAARKRVTIRVDGDILG